jgi:hypothetical protein
MPSIFDSEKPLVYVTARWWLNDTGDSEMGETNICIPAESMTNDLFVALASLGMKLKETPAIQKEVKIQKIDKEKHMVYGVVLEPDTFDLQGDIITAEEIEKAAHDFAMNSRIIGKSHEEVIKGAVPLETFIVRSDNYKINDSEIKKGSWMMGVHIPDDEWPDVESGKINAFSIGGTGTRTPTEV